MRRRRRRPGPRRLRRRRARRRLVREDVVEVAAPAEASQRARSFPRRHAALALEIQNHRFAVQCWLAVCQGAIKDIGVLGPATPLVERPAARRQRSPELRGAKAVQRRRIVDEVGAVAVHEALRDDGCHEGKVLFGRRLGDRRRRRSFRRRWRRRYVEVEEVPDGRERVDGRGRRRDRRDPARRVRLGLGREVRNAPVHAVYEAEVDRGGTGLRRSSHTLFGQSTDQRRFGADVDRRHFHRPVRGVDSQPRLTHLAPASDPGTDVEPSPAPLRALGPEPALLHLGLPQTSAGSFERRRGARFSAVSA
mmetsp:Transcript_7615/g.20073  ORF Transcript_7615/g.20073 Transcript_7615/m.20073 type:complete len:307 (+) Transcript_7615:916-1836(+)